MWNEVIKKGMSIFPVFLSLILVMDPSLHARQHFLNTLMSSHEKAVALPAESVIGTEQSPFPAAAPSAHISSTRVWEQQVSTVNAQGSWLSIGTLGMGTSKSLQAPKGFVGLASCLP